MGIKNKMNGIRMKFWRLSVLLKKVLSKHTYAPELDHEWEAKAHGKDGLLASKNDIIMSQIRHALKWKEADDFFWMYGFAYKTDWERNAYLPYPEFRSYRNKINLRPSVFRDGGESFNYIALLRDKFYFGQLLESLGFNTPKIRFLINGESGFIKEIATGKEYPLTAITDFEIDGFCKISIGECGTSVFHLRVVDGHIFINKDEISVADFVAMIGSNIFILQERIEQHKALADIYPGSVNTIRALTIKNDKGEYKFLGALLRVGARGNNVDNWAKGGVAIGINPDGSLYEYGCYEFIIDGRYHVAQHPDTGVIFKECRIPGYDEVIRQAVELHKYFPYIGSIGWDITITDDGPCFIEGNDNHELSILQAACGGVKKEWDEFFGIDN